MLRTLNLGRSFKIFSLLVGIILLFPAAGVSQEESLGTLDWLKKVSLWNFGSSPNALHFAYATDDSLFVDGRKVLTCDLICPASLMWTPDSNAVIVWGNSEERWRLFSYDVSTGSIKERKNYPSIIIQNLPLQRALGVRLGPDMWAKNLPNGIMLSKGRLSEDFQETPAVDRRTIFSRKGTRIAYAVCVDKQKNTLCENNWQVYIDDRPIGKLWQKIWMPDLIFSPDGDRLAFSGRLKDEWYVSVGSAIFGPYDNSGSISFSNNSKHYAFLAKNGKQVYLILDGIRQQVPGEDIGQCIVSDEGRILAYSVKLNGKWRLGEGSSGKLTSGYYDQVRKIVSHHSGRYAAIVRVQDKEFVIDSATQSNAYKEVGEPVFSPNGSRIVYQAKTLSGEAVVAIGDMKSKTYPRIWGNPFFTSENSIRYIISEEDGSSLKVIEESINDLK